MTALWLFDIDGTLVNINHLHLQAHQASYKDVLNINVPAGKIWPTFGMGGHEERKAVLKSMGISLGIKTEDKKIIEAIIKRFIYHFTKLLAKSKVLPLPGAVEFLSYLSKDKNNLLGVVTGNEKETARKILAKAKLRPYFSICSGDDGRTKGRADIVRQALKEAGKKGGKLEKVIIIGDTAHDIKAGKVVRAYTVGVATGTGTGEELAEAGADLIIPTMKEYRRILDVYGGKVKRSTGGRFIPKKNFV